MSPVGAGVLSLTRFYQLHDLLGELALVAPGMTEAQVRRGLGGARAGLAAHVVLYESGKVIDDPLLQACRSGSKSAQALQWTALVMADHRLAEIVETYLTDGDGKLVADRFDTPKLETALESVLPNVPTRKPASNILSYLRDSGVVDATTYGKTIVGIKHSNPTAPFVRDAVRYILFRLQHLQLPYPLDVGDEEATLAIKANHWLNLTPDEWRAGYSGTPTDVATTAPPPGPPVTGPPPVASEVEVEAHNTESYEVSGQTTHTAVRREQSLVIAYKEWMEAKGSEIVRFRIRPSNTPAHLFNDIHDKTRNHLIEGKADASRPSIRMAIGQLMDYRRFVPAGAKLAVLTRRRPHRDLEDLLASLNIASIWRSDDGSSFEDNASGDFS